MISHVYRGNTNNLIICLDDTNQCKQNISTYLKIIYPGANISIIDRGIQVQYLDNKHVLEQGKYYIIPNFATDRRGISFVESNYDNLFVNFGLKGVQDSFNYNQQYFKLMKNNLFKK